MNKKNWALTTGCESLGAGCESCPSLWEYKRKGWDYSIKIHPEKLFEPLENNEPTYYTVSFGSDLFHAEVPDLFIDAVFKIINRAPGHTFELMTKRVERLSDMASSLQWPDNVLVGTTVESADQKWRVKYLKDVPTDKRFVSFVPLLGEVGEVDLSGIMSAGGMGEEWELKRPFDQQWLDNIKRQCGDQSVQWIDSYSLYEQEAA